MSVYDFKFTWKSITFLNCLNIFDNYRPYNVCIISRSDPHGKPHNLRIKTHGLVIKFYATNFYYLYIFYKILGLQAKFIMYRRILILLEFGMPIYNTGCA